MQWVMQMGGPVRALIVAVEWDVPYRTLIDVGHLHSKIFYHKGDLTGLKVQTKSFCCQKKNEERELIRTSTTSLWMRRNRNPFLTKPWHTRVPRRLAHVTFIYTLVNQSNVCPPPRSTSIYGTSVSSKLTYGIILWITTENMNSRK